MKCDNFYLFEHAQIHFRIFVFNKFDYAQVLCTFFKYNSLFEWSLRTMYSQQFSTNYGIQEALPVWVQFWFMPITFLSFLCSSIQFDLVLWFIEFEASFDKITWMKTIYSLLFRPPTFSMLQHFLFLVVVVWSVFLKKSVYSMLFCSHIDFE